MKFIVIIFLASAITFTTVNAYAWGKLGHQVVCDIAWRESSPRLKKVLSTTARRMNYKTFAESCVWADSIKGQAQYDYLKPLHYINVRQSQQSVDRSPCLRSSSQRSPSKQSSSQLSPSQQFPPQCVVTAITALQQQIRASVASGLSREQAIVLLSHLVGDIHQPLHVSYVKDRGGTRKKVVFEGRVMSLHQLWDNGLLYCQLAKAGKSSIAWRHLGRQLHQSLPAAPQPSSVVDWANESLLITQTIYAQQHHKVLPASYCDQFYPMATKRLQLAGYRLATLLQQTLVP